MGFSGGIWLLWRKNDLRITILQSHFQALHAIVEKGCRSWWLTTVYGDFNAILSEEEKAGGAPFNPSEALGFRDTLDACNLIDVGSKGSPFTWKGARLVGIQQAIQRSPNPHLERLEWEVSEELEQVLLQEEILWFQKSRFEWVRFGDRNTKYFYTRTIIKRRRMKIESLRATDGEWVTDAEVLRDMVVAYFRNFYGDSSSGGTLYTTANFSALPQEAKTILTAAVEVAELRRALFAMPSFMAPGPDGFQAVFFQNNWEVVFPSLLAYARAVFEAGQSVAPMNPTLIALISKLSCPEMLSHFRPISLCNQFLADMLVSVGIPETLRRVIMDCVTTTTMQALWNGEATEEFIPKRGIGQGCPLSPYLFVLCIERLAHLIYDSVSSGRWRPIRVRAQGLAISHIMFADDILLFVEASEE
ncbi:hypothetical protein CRG98_018997 [Punica granatum]|uniref:Reverse transcriptase domain-containing protein n=1 Tax=Punica granatum TaxID=22663 RepID=A0A2I0JW53_PUNGR|nr:hypothetical protein CRG98_018997 [Punica granatum]